MKRWVLSGLKAILRFWYGFIVGDDWSIAAAVAVALGVARASSLAGINTWGLFTLIVLGGLGLSLWHSVKRLSYNPKSTARLNRILGGWLALWGPLIMVAVTPVLSSYLKNVSETSIQDLLLPIILNIVVATLIASIFIRQFLRQRLAYYLVAITMTLVLTNSFESKIGGIVNVVNSVLPFTVQLPVVVIVYLVGGTWILIRLGQWVSQLAERRHWRVNEIMAAVTIAISIIFVLELIPSVRDLAAAWPQFFYRPAALPASHPTSAQLSAKPDIYYILLEDYANQNVLQSQMNYDNSNFLQYLSGQGFTNVPGANSNYPYTVNSVASTFDANYLSDSINKFSASAVQTMIPYFQTARYSPVISQLKSLGYSYDLLGDWYESSSYSPLADHNYVNDDEIVVLNHTYNIDDFTDSEVQQNVLWSFIKPGLKIGKYRLFGYNTLSDLSLVASQLSELKTLATQPAGGRFIFSQILVPHNFFYFNADGSLNDNPTADNSGEPIKLKDTNEILFINAQIEPIISKIMQQSNGKADIILQSDEGPEPGVMNYTGYGTPDIDKTQIDMSKWSVANLQMKFGVLASYYIPGASSESLSAAADPVNIFRLVLNTDFNATLPYLPECYYGYPQGINESFVYQGVGQQLVGQASSSCPQNGNFIKPGPTKQLKSKIKQTNAEEPDGS